MKCASSYVHKALTFMQQKTCSISHSVIEKTEFVAATNNIAGL